MKAEFISLISKEIANLNKSKATAQLYFEKLKNSPTIAYIEEVINTTSYMTCDSYNEATLVIPEECHLDLACSIIGEIEDELGLESYISINQYSEQVYYIFQDKDKYDIGFQIKIARPLCQWVVTSEKKEFYKGGELKSNTQEKTIVCT